MRRALLSLSVFTVLCLQGLVEASNLKVLYTSALIEDLDGSRQAAYIRNLQKLKEYGCDVYVVESCSEGPSYLDEYCDQVCYTKSNDPKETKSTNEAVSMLIGMKHFNFSPDDMVIKVTGRYVFEDNKFVSFVQDNIDADIIARIWRDGDAYAGYWAIKYKYFVDMIDYYFHVNRNAETMIEWVFGRYISLRKQDLKITPIPRLYDYPTAWTCQGQ